MFLPYDSTFSLWLMPVSWFGWEEAPPVKVLPDTTDSTCMLAVVELNCLDNTPGPLITNLERRLVHRGVKWLAYPVSGMRENAAWESAAQTRRDEDERRAAANSHRIRSTFESLPAPRRFDNITPAT